ncbi:unnamed protein product [Adineta steineri]|uniref:Uncharacterized protein n=1 Tax=Adineta steineri TaxID=433720 RepID=A0A814DAR1_9BILA|nr:unnamed protein product [Adineta steineri]CAF0953271.1 unnamed protein product [Adineta steineri]CAF3957219.1 unnamed protein product [Adineta steineri]CAF4086092.1 unnamed protein product [Adineta steineri]
MHWFCVLVPSILYHFVIAASFHLEPQEFAAAGTCARLHCQGRPCARCNKCRDWHFTGDQDQWNWVCNWENWNDADWSQWRSGSINFFTKRDDANCDGDIYFRGLIYDLLYDGDRNDGHLCLCEKH